MITVAKALEIVKRETPKSGVENVPIGDSVGRILGGDVCADSDMPPFDRSQMDGFALKALDTKRAPYDLKIVGESAAGHGWHKTLKAGQCVRIMTGAPIPKGADAVQKLELTAEKNGSGDLPSIVTILEPVKRGKFIVSRGCEAKKGDVIFEKGEPITAESIAGLAAFGLSNIRVGKRPTLAVLATGSEIVDIDKKPAKDQIRNSNSYTVKALAEKFGCVVEMLPIAADNITELRSQISKAVESAAVVVITGGVSVGKYDLTKAALADLGAKIYFDRIQLKPGKPTVFAKLGNCLIFGLPGNPISVTVTFYLFVRTAVIEMQGRRESAMPEALAVVGDAVKGTRERDSFLPATVKSSRSGSLIAEPLRWHGSSDFIGFARASALIVVPKGKNFYKGDVVRIAYL